MKRINEGFIFVTENGFLRFGQRQSSAGAKIDISEVSDPMDATFSALPSLMGLIRNKADAMGFKYRPMPVRRTYDLTKADGTPILHEWQAQQ